LDKPTPQNFGLDLEDIFEILERRRKVIIAGAVVGLLLGVMAYLLLPPVYTASTTILVEPQEVPTDFVRPTVRIEIEQRLQTLNERVTSYNNLNELIDRISAERLDPSGKSTREALMRRIRSSLDVTIKGSRFTRTTRSASVFEVSFHGDEPELVSEITREIASLFIAENIKDRTKAASSTAEFLDRELERIRTQVEEHETKLSEFRQNRMGALPEQLESNLRSLDRMNSELAALLEGRESVAQRVALLRRQLQTIRGSGGGGSALARQLDDARARLLSAEGVYTEEHPSVISLRREVQALEGRMAESTGSRGSFDADPVVMGLVNEIETAEIDAAKLRRREELLVESIQLLEARVAQTPAREEELRNLTRDYTELTATYQTLLSKKYEAAIARNLEQAQKGERFKVLRPARVPKFPSFPDIRYTVPAGLAIGLLLTGTFIGVQEFRHPAFRSVSKLARSIGLPVVASIPKIENDRIYVEPPSGDVDPRLVVYTAPESAPAEQYRGFAPIFLEDEKRRVVLVTSAQRGDGKSLTTMNLALTFACDLDRHTLLIDGDLRRPTAHRLVRISRRQGLSNVLKNQLDLEEAAVRTTIPNLSVLPAGPSVKNPLALLTSDRFLEVLEEAKARYDVIFIDSPPLLPVVDTKLMKKLADLVLFVVRADSTPRDAVLRSMADMRDVAGVVFNQVSPGSFERFYYYDAYSRYAYGEPSADDRSE
jgi:polysaccharide chain length determinant protein (PEP-CTERM system associated)